MRFVCDLCPSTASKGQTVIIGNYEKWIRHLLSPVHQAEQGLTISRKTYWPAAEWIACIYDMPTYCNDTAELYVDVMMNLSTYGYVEAIYYGSKTKAIFVALQLYGVQFPPLFLKGPVGQKFDIKIQNRTGDNGKNDKLASTINNSTMRFQTSDLEPIKSVSVADAATSPIPWAVGNITSDTKDEARNIPKERIKYTRDFLLSFRKTEALPQRFIEVVNFPLELLMKGKPVNLAEMEQNRPVNPGVGVEQQYPIPNYYRGMGPRNGFRGSLFNAAWGKPGIENSNGFRGNGYRGSNGYNAYNPTRGTWRGNVLTNVNSRWNVQNDETS